MASDFLPQSTPPQSTPPPPAPGPIARIIAASAGEPLLTCLAVLAALVFGIASLRTTPLDAIADLSDVQVIVSSEWPGQSPDRSSSPGGALIVPHNLAKAPAVTWSPWLRPGTHCCDGSAVRSFQEKYTLDSVDSVWNRPRNAFGTRVLPGGILRTTFEFQIVFSPEIFTKPGAEGVWAEPTGQCVPGRSHGDENQVTRVVWYDVGGATGTRRTRRLLAEPAPGYSIGLSPVHVALNTDLSLAFGAEASKMLTL